MAVHLKPYMAANAEQADKQSPADKSTWYTVVFSAKSYLTKEVEVKDNLIIGLILIIMGMIFITVNYVTNLDINDIQAEGIATTATIINIEKRSGRSEAYYRATVKFKTIKDTEVKAEISLSKDNMNIIRKESQDSRGLKFTILYLPSDETTVHLPKPRKNQTGYLCAFILIFTGILITIFKNIHIKFI